MKIIKRRHVMYTKMKGAKAGRNDGRRRNANRTWQQRQEFANDHHM